MQEWKIDNIFFICFLFGSSSPCTFTEVLAGSCLVFWRNDSSAGAAQYWYCVHDNRGDGIKQYHQQYIRPV